MILLFLIVGIFGDYLEFEGFFSGLARVDKKDGVSGESGGIIDEIVGE